MLHLVVCTKKNTINVCVKGAALLINMFLLQVSKISFLL